MPDDKINPVLPTQTATPTVEEKLENAAESTKQKIHQDPNAAQKLAPTPQLQDEVVDIEKELLEEIINRLNQNRITKEEAQKLAKDFLSLLPMQDQKDLLAKLYQLSQTSNAAKGIYLEYAKPFEENDRQKKLELMSQHIQQGNIDHALAVAKGGTQNAN